MNDPQADQKFELALAAIGGAVANLRVAVALIGELRAGQQPGKQPEAGQQDEGPKMFRRKPPVRPTTAVGAESQQSEG